MDLNELEFYEKLTEILEDLKRKTNYMLLPRSKDYPRDDLLDKYQEHLYYALKELTKANELLSLAQPSTQKILLNNLLQTLRYSDGFFGVLEEFLYRSGWQKISSGYAAPCPVKVSPYRAEDGPEEEEEEVWEKGVTE